MSSFKPTMNYRHGVGDEDGDGDGDGDGCHTSLERTFPSSDAIQSGTSFNPSSVNVVYTHH